MQDGSGGFFLLLTESFAVRALLGSAAAGALAWVVVRLGIVRARHARRLLLLAPVIAVAGAALASLGEAFLPRLWLASTAAGPADQFLNFLGERWFLTPHQEIDVLLLVYMAVVGGLLVRRGLGLLAVRRLLATARPPDGHATLTRTFARLTVTMDVPSAELRLLRGCPGGAVATGLVRGVVVADPDVLAQLDEHETEALLAHELAHVRRRDALTGLVAGIVRDLTFFLPPVHLVARWLRLEREESADELAAGSTGKPGALASSILNVWERAGGTRRTLACAAVPTGREHPGTRRRTRTRRLVTTRVERLVSTQPLVGTWRRRIEISLAGGITGVAIAAAVAVPTWLVARWDAAALAVGYVQAPVVHEDDAPAFATFRALTPEASARGDAPAEAVADDALAANGWELVGLPSEVAHSPALTDTDVAGEADGDGIGGQSTASSIPLVDGRIELRDGVRQQGTPTRMVWASDDAWRLTSTSQHATARETRPLLTVSEPGQQVGVFVLGHGAQ